MLYNHQWRACVCIGALQKKLFSAEKIILLKKEDGDGNEKEDDNYTLENSPEYNHSLWA